MTFRAGVLTSRPRQRINRDPLHARGDRLLPRPSLAHPASSLRRHRRSSALTVQGIDLPARESGSSQLQWRCTHNPPRDAEVSQDSKRPMPRFLRDGLLGDVARLGPDDLVFPRHTAASLAVQSGANVKAIQRKLGYASAAMTLDVYADLFDDDLDAAPLRRPWLTSTRPAPQFGSSSCAAKVSMAISSRPHGPRSSAGRMWPKLSRAPKNGLKSPENQRSREVGRGGDGGVWVHDIVDV